jgi:hypothetical protein
MRGSTLSDQAKANKPKPDRKKYVAFQFFSNLVGVVVVVAFLAWIVFGLFGPGSGTLTEVRAFAPLFLLCFVLIQCHGAVVNTRRDFVRGRWVIGDAEGHEPDGVFNPWRRMGPSALPVAIAISLAAWALVPLAGDGTFKLLKIEVIVFFPLLICTTLLIARFVPPDQVSFAHALDEGSAVAVSGFAGFFLLEYFLPWAVIQGVINLGIGVKQFKWVLEGTEPVEAITSQLVAWDFGIVFGILYFFMYLSSDAQVRGDVRLGRLAPKQFSVTRLRGVGIPGAALGLILSTVLLMFLVGSIMQGILPAAGFEEFSVRSAVAFKTMGAVLGTLAGCGMGVWWGRRKEAALMDT